MIELSDINFSIGSVNPSGIGDTIYFIPRKDIIAFPWITDEMDEAILKDGYSSYGNFMGDDREEDNHFILHEGKYWYRMYTTQGKSKMSWDVTGERDHKVVLNKAQFYYPKLNVLIVTLAKMANNGDFVFVVRHDGRYYVVGSRKYRATLQLEGNSGDAAGSAKGVTINVESADTTPLPVYKGALLMQQGVIDCNENTFTKYSDMATNFKQTYAITGGNTVVFNALSNEGRIHLEGTGSITLDVSVDGTTFKNVSHSVAFENGKAIVPCQFIIGDVVKISATTLTLCVVNWNHVNAAERV